MALTDQGIRYYVAWKDVYEDEVNYKNSLEIKTPWARFCNSLLTVGVYILFGSYIPILPALTLVLWNYYSQTQFIINEETALKFVGLWMGYILVVSSIFAMIATFSRWKNKRRAKEPRRRETLVGDQVIFVLSYQIYSELDNYLATEVEKNYEYALRAFHELFFEVRLPKDYEYSDECWPMPRWCSGVEKVPQSYLSDKIEQMVIGRQLHNQYRWWQIDEETIAIAKAFESLQQKVEDRIIDKHQLKQVHKIFLLMAESIFVSLNKVTEKLEEPEITNSNLKGKENLLALVDLIDSLDDYKRVRHEPETKDKGNKMSLFNRFNLWHEKSGFFRFICGYCIGMSLGIASFILLGNIWSFNNSIIAQTVITVSFALAIAYSKLAK